MNVKHAKVVVQLKKKTESTLEIQAVPVLLEHEFNIRKKLKMENEDVYEIRKHDTQAVNFEYDGPEFGMNDWNNNDRNLYAESVTSFENDECLNFNYKYLFCSEKLLIEIYKGEEYKIKERESFNDNEQEKNCVGQANEILVHSRIEEYVNEFLILDKNIKYFHLGCNMLISVKMFSIFGKNTFTPGQARKRIFYSKNRISMAD